jgi:hypothetical protein
MQQQLQSGLAVDPMDPNPETAPVPKDVMRQLQEQEMRGGPSVQQALARREAMIQREMVARDEAEKKALGLSMQYAPEPVGKLDSHVPAAPVFPGQKPQSVPGPDLASMSDYSGSSSSNNGSGVSEPTVARPQFYPQQSQPGPSPTSPGFGSMPAPGSLAPATIKVNRQREL